jgi:hypothetical protein
MKMMKASLRKAMAIMAVLAGIAAIASAAESQGKVSLRVEAGDTLISLFGPDWQKAYQQNKVAVMRQGVPVTSPDILVEGMIVTITPDVYLTPRAFARCDELRRFREELKARLAILQPQLANDSSLQESFSQCLGILEDDFRFASDTQFVARQIEQMQSALRSKAARPLVTSSSVEQGATGGLIYVAVLCVIATTLFLFVVRRKQKPQYPSGEARYQEALTELKKVVGRVNG